MRGRRELLFIAAPGTIAAYSDRPLPRSRQAGQVETAEGEVMVDFPVFIFTVDTSRILGGPPNCFPAVTVGNGGQPSFIALFRDEASALATKRDTTIAMDGAGISKFATAQSLLPVLIQAMAAKEAAIETQPFGRRPQEWATRLPVKVLLDEVARLAELERQAISN